MDAGDLHTAKLMATALVPAAALLFLRPRLPTPARLLYVVLLVLASVFVVPKSHMCGAGTAVMQVVVPLMTVMIVVPFVASPGAAAVLALAILGSASYLQDDYHDLVHGSEWTGNPKWALRDADVWAQHRREEAATSVADAPEQDRPRPAGWLEAVGLMADPPKGARVTVEDVWHTGYTRLWRTIRTPNRLWYSGGPPATAAANLEWRDG